MRTKSGSLRKRIGIAVALGMAVILLCFGVVSHYIVEGNIEDSLAKKLALARLIRNNIDNILKDNINRLYDISLSGSINLNDDNFSPEQEALSTAYKYSIFTDGVFLLDRNGNLMLNYPEKLKDANINLLGVEPVSRMVMSGRPVVSNVYTTEVEKRKVLFVLVPLKDRNGSPVGYAGGEIDPTNPMLARMFKLVNIGPNAVIDIIDSNGVIVASSKSDRTFTYCEHLDFFVPLVRASREGVTTCKEHEKIHVTSHLEMAPWGVVIQEPVRDVFASATKLKRIFLALGLVFVGAAFMSTISLGRSIVDPITTLTRATGRIARGDLSRAIPVRGTNEIRTLSQSFETMRGKLAASLESIQKHNVELENRVTERTAQLQEGQERITYLLDKIIASGEDERKRIARDLHDETLQDLLALLMRIDMFRLYPEKITEEKIEEVRQIILKTQEGLNAVIHNLRPSLLDDLGLEAAIKWLLDTHLARSGAEIYFRIIGARDRRFDPELEIKLFRIVQEAIVNIARHADARNVFVLLKTDHHAVSVDIEDDGEGFDGGCAGNPRPNGRHDFRGLGLMGMKERAALMGGKLEIYSLPGCGTTVSLRVPVNGGTAEYA